MPSASTDDERPRARALERVARVDRQEHADGQSPT
jgi:hypothetical protein